MKKFHAVDYVVFCIMLLISAAIGIYHGCTGGRQRTTSEYLLGNRSMKMLPISISLLVSFLSAITLMGVPAEVFTYGVQYFVVILSYFFIVGISAVVFLPIFYNLRLTSVNEYLELRFTPGIRVLVTCITIIRGLLYSALALYTPCLALEAVAGIPMTLSVLLTGAVCIFYTTLGGIKAVVWADVFQAFVMVAGIITVMIVGLVNVGGMNEVWRINKERGRLNFFDFDPDPTVRNTFWTLTIGGTFTNLPTWSVAQLFVQRYLALGTLKSAKRALLLNIPFLVFVVTLCCLDGLVIFATYAGCDLRASKRIQRNDQVLPFFVIDKLGHLIGIPGLFVSCLFCGALSSLSSVINSLSTITLEDLIKKRFHNLSDNGSVKVTRVVAILFGAIAICGAFVINYLDSFVLQFTYSIAGVFGGPIFGAFVLGIFIHRANYKGAYIGLITGISILGWISVGSILYPPDRNPGSISIKECSFYNATTYANTTEDGIISRHFVGYSNPLAKLYSLSFYWYGAAAFAITFVIGSIFSVILESEQDRVKLVKKELRFDIPAFLRSLNPRKTSETVRVNLITPQTSLECCANRADDNVAVTT